MVQATKYHLPISLIFILLTFIMNPELNQAQATTGKLDSSVVNFRSGPGTGYEIIGQAFRGYELTVLAEEGGWLKCKTNTGKIVYVRSDLVTLIRQAEYTNSAIKVKLNGTPLSFSTSLYSENNRILVPARTLYETVGANVEWNSGTQTCKVTWGNTQIFIPIDSANPTVNGSAWQIDTPARLFQQRIYIPVRFAAEALGGTAAWDPDSSTIYLTVPPADGINAVSVQIVSPIVNLRSGPGINYDKVDTVSSGETLTVVSQQDGWYKVSRQGKEGWVASWVVNIIWGLNI